MNTTRIFVIASAALCIPTGCDDQELYVDICAGGAPCDGMSSTSLATSSDDADPPSDVDSSSDIVHAPSEESMTYQPPPRAGLSSSRNFFTREEDGNKVCDDVLWYQPNKLMLSLWLGTDHDPKSVTFAADNSVPNIVGDYKSVAGDFDGDSIAEALFYDAGGMPELIWKRKSGADYILAKPRDGGTETPLKIDYAAIPIAGDFDGSGTDDILWYAYGTKPDTMWWSASPVDNFRFSTVDFSIGDQHTPVSGDFNGDGTWDILWYTAGDNNPEVLWLGMLDRTFKHQHTGIANVVYLPFSGDFDGDGTHDIYWLTPNGGPDYVWYFKKGDYPGHYAGFVSQNPKDTNGTKNVTTTSVAIPGDFNCDGYDDIMWYRPGGNSDDRIWYGQPNRSFVESSLNVIGSYGPP